MTNHRSTTAVGIALVCMALIATGCNAVMPEHGSGTAETMTYEVEGFDGIDIGGSFELRASAGEEFSVQITVDDNFTDDVRAEVKGSTLHVDFRRGNRKALIQPVAVVTAPRLDYLAISGASAADVDGVDSASFRLEVSGASDVSVDGIADTLHIETSGASSLTFAGSAGQAQIEASGSSEVDLTQMSIDDVSLEVSGASDLQLGPSTTVRGEVSGASSLEIDQDTRLAVEVTGASNVDRRN